MSTDAITLVSEAEAEARRLKSEAATEGKRRLAESETQGEAALKAAAEKAAAELRVYRDEAGRKAAEAAQTVRADTERQKDALRAQAEARLAEAADRIVERIVV